MFCTAGCLSSSQTAGPTQPGADRQLTVPQCYHFIGTGTCYETLVLLRPGVAVNESKAASDKFDTSISTVFTHGKYKTQFELSYQSEHILVTRL